MKSNKYLQRQSSSHHSPKSSHYIAILRILLFLSITLAGVTISGLSYYFIRDYQVQIEIEEFYGIARDHFGDVKSTLKVQTEANYQVSILAAWHCPHESDWPNCNISSRELVSRTSSLTSMSRISLFFVAPIILPNNRYSFEEFALNYYDTDGGYPNHTGWSDFGPGIFDYDDLQNKVKSPNHTDPSTSKYDLLAPVLYASSVSSSYFMANTYNNPIFKPSIDEILGCLNISSHNQTSCQSITDFLPEEMSKVSAILSPIFPADQPDTAIGFAGALISWKDLLSTRKKHDFQCAVSSSASPTVRTFRIKSGIAHESAEIDHYPHSVDHFWHESQRSFVLDLGDISSSGVTYTITYYSTDNPPSETYAGIACLCCVGMTILISIIFVGFNTLIQNAALETDNLLTSKRTFVRFVSHEIRTPLNTISLSIRLVSENLLALKTIHESSSSHPEKLSQVMKLLDDCLELIDDLHESSAVAVTTLNDLINYDKVETKTFTIEEKDVKIWSVIDTTVRPMILQAKEKNINLHFATKVSGHHVNDNINLNNLRVVGDSIKLAQVIRNLVSNAFKFTPRDGEVKITGLPLPPTHSHSLTICILAQYEPIEIPVTTPSSRFRPSKDYIESHDSNPVDPPIGHVIIRVSDSGPGLSEEQQRSLFQQGVQFNANQLQAGQGSGLGLWISKEIVNLHRGHIRVMSDGLGFGSTFEVKLPVVLRESAVNVETAIPENRKELKVHIETFLGHVLVVDDAASNRKIVSRLLKSRGFICHEAENGQECVDKVLAGEHPYKFILLDSDMPVMNGPSAARQLRDNKCDLLIIGVTGNVLPEDIEYFMSQGANIVMSKPLDVDLLLSEYENHCNSLQSKV